VDLGALRSNVERLRRRLPSATRFIAVVKANGYGHGARAVAQAALAAGAWGLAGVTLEEAAEVRDLLQPERILVLGPLLPEDAPEAAAAGYALGVSSLELVRALADAAGSRRVPVHLKLDTGMGRYGAQVPEFEAIARYVTNEPRLELAGTWSHLASAGFDAEYSQAQYERFMAATEGLPGIRHLANSAGAARYPLDAVRIGIALYGCEDPFCKPALQLRARVGHLKTVPVGMSIGYGRTWTADRPTRIATVTIGYADGVHRVRANRGEVLVRGTRAPLIGAVSMDSITLDVSALPEVKVGDTATLIGADGDGEISAQEVATWSETITYEVLTSIGRRVARSYLP